MKSSTRARISDLEKTLVGENEIKTKLLLSEKLAAILWNHLTQVKRLVVINIVKRLVVINIEKLRK